ncbi:MAG: hypothetical protein AAF604_11910 [Acidobacteriota bacterium]
MTRDDAMGEPISLLGDLREPPREGFVEQVRQRIERRHLAADLVGLSWSAVTQITRELLGATFDLMGSPEEKNDDG